MATGNLVTTNGKKLAFNRIFKGTPDYLAPVCFKVGTGTTTPAVADTDLDTAIQIAGVDTKDFVVGYPSLDESTLNATIRGILLTTECNGNSITEFGTFNKDGTPLMFSRSVFTTVTKTATVQVIFVEKDVVI